MDLFYREAMCVCLAIRPRQKAIKAWTALKIFYNLQPDSVCVCSEKHPQNFSNQIDPIIFPAKTITLFMFVCLISITSKLEISRNNKLAVKKTKKKKRERERWETELALLIRNHQHTIVQKVNFNLCTIISLKVNKNTDLIPKTAEIQSKSGKTKIK